MGSNWQATHEDWGRIWQGAWAGVMYGWRDAEVVVMVVMEGGRSCEERR